MAAEGRSGFLHRAARHPLTAPLVLAVGAVAGSVYLYGTDPHTPGQLLPRCPVEWATGLLCPACGGTRMAYDLLHGDLTAAFHDNAALLLLGIPLAAYLWFRRVGAGLRGRVYRPEFGAGGIAAVVGTAVVWTVARNLVGP